MKREDLIDAIGGIDIKILEESQELRQKRGKKAVLWPAVAAGIVFFLAVAMVIYMIGNSATSAQPEEVEKNTTEPVEIMAEDAEAEDIKTEDTEAEDSKAPEATDEKPGEEHRSSDEKETSGKTVSPEKAEPLDENDPQTMVIRLTPDAEASDRYVLFTDDHYHVCRIGSPYGGPQAFIMLKNDDAAWQVAAYVTSEKTTMSDQVDELKAAAGEFWQYYKTIYPVTEEWIKKAEDQIRENNVAVEYDPAHADPAETFSEDERRLLRDHVVISYDAMMTEAFVPDFIAWEFAYADHGYVRFAEPIFVMKMACPETEDPTLNRLIAKDLGSRKDEYYCMCAQVDLNGQPYENIMRAISGIREFFDEMNPGWDWVNGTGDKVKSASWNPSLGVTLSNCSTVGWCGENESMQVVRCVNAKIKANLEIFSGTDSYVSCSLIILRDGAPASYTIDGESYDSYHLYVSGAQKLTVEIDPVFDLHIGRLEIFLVNDQYKQHELMFQQWEFIVEQDEAPVMPEKLHETVGQRELVRGLNGNTVYELLWEADDEDREKMTAGPYTIYYHPGDDLILEGVAGEPGFYRTVLLSGGRYAEAYENGQKINWIDWQSTGDDMLEFTFCLNEMRDEEEVVAMITTDLSEGREFQAQFCVFPARLIYEE